MHDERLTSPRPSARPKKPTPAHFQFAGTSLVRDLIAGAEAVADRSFLGSGRHAAQAGPPAAPDVATAPQPQSAWAHAAIHHSYADAKLRSARWRAYGFRIAPEVLARLKDRLNSDRRTTGNSSLATGHYVDAALRTMPESVTELISMAEEFGATRLWDSERTQPSTYRVGEQAYELASTLKLVLQEADFGRRGTQVVSAGIERYLDALDREGALRRPERHRP
ncbi:hypothetical protein ACTVZO_44265 [Streptomyces sp. IBSNAI002]|uniref:hypothetical protein n=1 Tax=Streptomyces sp. IBSNAI002 TaxID=3457500 RepID=UPI003FCF0E00